MNIINVENVKELAIHDKGITVLHDYKMGGAHRHSIIVVLNEKEINDPKISYTLRGYYIDGIIIPKGTYLCQELTTLMSTQISRKFKTSYY